MGQFETNFERTANPAPGGLLTPDELAGRSAPAPAGPPDAYNQGPLQFGPNFRPIQRQNGTGPIGVVTDSPFPNNYIPGVSDLPPDAHPQGGWNGNALAPQQQPARTAPAEVQPGTVNAGQGYPRPGETQLPVAAAPRPRDDSWTSLFNNTIVERLGTGAVNAVHVADWEKFGGQKFLPDFKKVYGVTQPEWKELYHTNLGKTVAWSWIANSALDGWGPLNDRQTTWKTWAVDVGAPWIAKAALGRWGVVGSTVATVAAHEVAKYFEPKA
jgi:hypothetical protein